LTNTKIMLEPPQIREQTWTGCACDLLENEIELEDIGFYTLSRERAATATIHTPLTRCELILTDRCNFKCTYCRGLKKEQRGDISQELAHKVVDLWLKDHLKNIRFSGGEPTLWIGLEDLIIKCKNANVERIAISTNGSASIDKYENLLIAGANDFSVSLDSGCCAISEQMTGNIKGSWDKVVKSIQFLSQHTYVTIGIVLTADNIKQARDTIIFADSLGVSDIRIIPAAQYSIAIQQLSLPTTILKKYPILQYRINNAIEEKSVRGLDKANGDCEHCTLVLDDMAIVGDQHYPCVIYLREGGNPIGKIGPKMRQERSDWCFTHNSLDDPICKNNCLDVCRQYNRIKKSTHRC